MVYIPPRVLRPPLESKNGVEPYRRCASEASSVLILEALVASIMRARFTIFLANGQFGLYQTFWRPGTGGGSTADATDILARVRASLDAIKATLSAGTSYVGQTAVDVLEDSTGVLTGSFTGTGPAAVVGTGSGDSLPANICYLVRNRTALVVNGRRLNGRSYISTPSEGNNDSAGKPLSATVAIVNAGLVTALTGGSTLSFPVVWHRPTNGAGGTSGAITSVACEPGYYGQQGGRRF